MRISLATVSMIMAAYLGVWVKGVGERFPNLISNQGRKENLDLEAVRTFSVNVTERAKLQDIARVGSPLATGSMLAAEIVCFGEDWFGSLLLTRHKTFVPWKLDNANDQCVCRLSHGSTLTY
jgi:hypothetical protein